MDKVMRRTRSLAAVLAVCVPSIFPLLGCGSDTDSHPMSQTFTLFDIEAAFQSHGTVAGLPSEAFLTTVNGADRVNTFPCFGEGKPCGYLTVELRINVPTVVIQPLYALVTPDLTPVAGKPLFVDVIPPSTFYSPFWQKNLAVVPNGPAAEGINSTRDILNQHLRIIPVAPVTCPLRPANVRVAEDGSQDVGEATGQVAPGTTAGAFVVGADDFQVAANGSIVELPFFQFSKPSDPAFQTPPKVAGVGPLFSGLPPDVSYNAAGDPYPRFGAFWRIYDTVLPASADAFHLAAHPGAARTDIADYEGRVALNGAGPASCFDDAAFPDSCVWLDSQASIEAHLGSASLNKTPITGVCPLVRWGGKQVKQPS
jgi:hypothetical protein